MKRAGLALMMMAKLTLGERVGSFEPMENVTDVVLNNKVVEDKDMTIEMDEDIAKIFRDSTAVSGK